jgi:hypothetical protein
VDSNVSKTPFAPESAADRLRKCLNKHGHGFHFRTLERCLAAASVVPWRFAVAEYPVTVREKEIHVDFVLGSGTHLVVAECKRTEGWSWGFARSSARVASPRPRADFMEWTGDGILRHVKWFGQDVNSPYDVVMEMKQDHCIASDRGGFDDALKHVIRARSGVIDELRTNAGELRFGSGAVVPVIFTTAQLVATETALATADDQGQLSDIVTAGRPWVWFDYNISRSLRPLTSHLSESETSATTLRGPTKSELLRSALDRESRRSIAIVHEKSIEPFLADLRGAIEVAEGITS